MMVVKSATKKKLMDRGVPEQYAHILADDRKWDQLRAMGPQEIKDILTDANIRPKIPIGKLSTMIWLIAGRMEIRFYEDNDTMIGFAPDYLDPGGEGVFYDYDLVLGKMERKVEGFRGLGSLFSDPTIHDWFYPSFVATGLLTNTGKVRMDKVPPQWNRATQDHRQQHTGPIRHGGDTEDDGKRENLARKRVERHQPRKHSGTVRSNIPVRLR